MINETPESLETSYFLEISKNILRAPIILVILEILEQRLWILRNPKNKKSVLWRSFRLSAKIVNFNKKNAHLGRFGGEKLSQKLYPGGTNSQILFRKILLWKIPQNFLKIPKNPNGIPRHLLEALQIPDCSASLWISTPSSPTYWGYFWSSVCAQA